jgi:Sulfotransferase family
MRDNPLCSDRPVLLAGSGRCGSTLLQSVLNTNKEFLIWGEHNGFLRQVAAAYYEAKHPRFPDRSGASATRRIKLLRDTKRWPAWDNLCGEAEFLEHFRTFIRSFFADPAERSTRWGFKEIRYAQSSDDFTLKLMFELFPQTRLIVLVREPKATIFSVVSHWMFADQRQGDIENRELDAKILGAAHSWNMQYLNLNSLSQAHASNCLSLHYEDLGNPKPYLKLARFLETSGFDFQSVVAQVKDASNKTDRTALLVRQRMQELQPEIDAATEAARAAYGYASPAESARVSATR